MGHVIGAALCADGVFRDWAVRSNIPSVASVEELSSFLKAASVDFIFSVANPFILPSDVLGRVRQGAFNYHDGPLPRYAGTRATSWALLAQETECSQLERSSRRVRIASLVTPQGQSWLMRLPNAC
ncbi:formyltransferase family protein [Bradyrhizobium sp. USDA 3458]|uniref:formyltransferase family protein n=1 Tax=Bradyrhizobium sp. USDA 3458 TaxID=2591461 RepID=UPI00132F6F80|nr:formyltransferase family protein [Bradyrhizobium sp. USDA 3458]